VPEHLDLTAWLRDRGLERYSPAFLDAEVTPECPLTEGKIG
jgi:hypothetical protein